jgi:signal peptidase I
MDFATSGRTTLFVLLLTLLAAMPAQAAEKIYTVAGTSMLPTLRPGEKITVRTDNFLPLCRSDLVAISLRNRKNPVVKRVVAVAGDRLAINGNRFWINDAELEPELVIDPRRWRSTINQLQNYNWIVPANTIFILGDNRRNSHDSRRLGLISVNQVCGQVINLKDDPVSRP